MPAFINTATTVGRFTNGVDRLLVRNHVGLRVGGGQGRFTEHVVRIAETFVFQLAGVRQRFGNGFPVTNCSPIRRIAISCPRPLRISGSPLLPMMRFKGSVTGWLRYGRNQFAGKQQAPGCRVNEQRRAAANVRMPVAVADFVADQRVAWWLYPEYAAALPPGTSAPRLPERRRENSCSKP